MKTNKNVPTLNTLENLATTIQGTNTFFLDKLDPTEEFIYPDLLELIAN